MAKKEGVYVTDKGYRAVGRSVFEQLDIIENMLRNCAEDIALLLERVGELEGEIKRQGLNVQSKVGKRAGKTRQ